MTIVMSMNSRDKILNQIASNQPEPVALPAIDLNMIVSYSNVYLQFKVVGERIGAKVVMVEEMQSLTRRIIEEKNAGKFVINTMVELGEVDAGIAYLSATQLEKLDTAYLKGTLGVAENAAVWIYDSQMINRLLPFICQHLVVVIDRKNIVPTMHDAYRCIDLSGEGFGVFIAGPSKTADIEQELVIGAHGPRTATIFVTNSKQD